jgi:hypothetical protein
VIAVDKTIPLDVVDEATVLNFRCKINQTARQGNSSAFVRWKVERPALHVCYTTDSRQPRLIPNVRNAVASSTSRVTLRFRTSNCLSFLVISKIKLRESASSYLRGAMDSFLPYALGVERFFGAELYYDGELSRFAKSPCSSSMNGPRGFVYSEQF